MPTRLRGITVAAVVLITGFGTANATLIDRGGGLIYDTELNVTWMKDAQYALTSGVSGSGRLDWQSANEWATGVEYYDASRDVYWDGWRLPTTINSASSYGYDLTGLSSELAYMYYINLGYAPEYTHDRWAAAPTSEYYNPFINLAYLGYWSGTETDFSGRAWAFHFHFGSQETTSFDDSQHIWLLRDGDVAVPEPTGIALMGLGLIGLGWVRRRLGR